MKNLTLLTIILIITISSCQKKQQSFDYTSQMGGMRIWNGYYSVNTPSGSTVDTLSDTSFAITIVNNSTINILGHTLHYSTYDTTNNAWVFSSKPASVLSYDTSSFLYYYRTADSMFFGFTDHISTAGNDMEFLNTQ